MQTEKTHHATTNPRPVAEGHGEDEAEAGGGMCRADCELESICARGEGQDIGLPILGSAAPNPKL